jgi:hypothetical protein
MQKIGSHWLTSVALFSLSIVLGVGALAVRADDFHTNTRDKLTPLTPSERREMYDSGTPCERRRELSEKWSGLKSVDLTLEQYKASHAYPGIWASCTQSC